MGQLIVMQNRQEQRENTDLFTEEFAEQASELRTHAQRERLVERAKEVAEMLDRLDGLLRVDREQAISLLTEYSGLLELVVEDIRSIRDIDEDFGGRTPRQLVFASQALKLERGLAYLLGIFSVVSSGEEMPVYNWKLVHRDVQEVLTISQSINDTGEAAKLPIAA